MQIGWMNRFFFTAWIYFNGGITVDRFLCILCVWCCADYLWARTTFNSWIRENWWRNRSIWLVPISATNTTIATHNYDCIATGSFSWVLWQYYWNSRDIQEGEFFINKLRFGSSFEDFFQVVKNGISYFMVMRQFMNWNMSTSSIISNGFFLNMDSMCEVFLRPIQLHTSFYIQKNWKYKNVWNLSFNLFFFWT